MFCRCFFGYVFRIAFRMFFILSLEISLQHFPRMFCICFCWFFCRIFLRFFLGILFRVLGWGVKKSSPEKIRKPTPSREGGGSSKEVGKTTKKQQPTSGRSCVYAPPCPWKHTPAQREIEKKNQKEKWEKVKATAKYNRKKSVPKNAAGRFWFWQQLRHEGG